MQPQGLKQFKNIAIFLLINVITLSYIAFGKNDDERYQAGLEAYQEQNYFKTYNLMTTLAESEYPGADAMLATLYKNGEGVKANAEKAAYWHEKAQQRINSETPKSVPVEASKTEVTNTELTNAEVIADK